MGEPAEKIEDDDLLAAAVPIDPFPPFEERPAYVVLDDWTEINGRKRRPGLYHCGAKVTKEAVELFEQWVSAPLHVVAVTSDADDNNFGRLLRLRNSHGRWREWSMPADLLSGDGAALRAELLNMGLELDPDTARRHLGKYILSRTPSRRVRCAVQTGWNDGCYVLPGEVIGPDAGGIVYQSPERHGTEYATAGTLEGWQRSVAAMAPGNPVLLLALSAAFVGPLLARCNAESGGLHLVGESSKGKSTTLDAAASVWGGPEHVRSWSATANGLEGVAALYNDGLLALDEINQADGREVGRIVYAIANGIGKQRASRTGSARAVTRWRCFVLSNGERTAEQIMGEAGKRRTAGQAVRLIDVPADRAFGAWDDLHGYPTGAALSDAIKAAAKREHGTAGRVYLENLSRDDRDFSGFWREVIADARFGVSTNEGQHRRVAARFALIAIAGELATAYGVTGWTQGEAIEAAAETFLQWMDGRTGSDERRQVIDGVAAFIDRHGDARFGPADGADAHLVRDRAGWWRDSANGREYLLTAEAMHEAVTGAEFQRALAILVECGAIAPPGSGGKTSSPVRIDGHRRRVYVVSYDALHREV